MRARARASSVVVVVACALGGAACRKGETAPAPGHDSSAPSAPSAATPPDSAAPASSAPSPPVAVGTARLVVQHVEATCMVAVGQPPQGFKVGVDLLLETSLDEDGGARTREHVFCPKTLADGGKVKPRLGIWENCRRDAACVVENDGKVECGKDTVELVIEDGKTLVRGAFGERVVAPHPMRILPVVKVRREAHVDC